MKTQKDILRETAIEIVEGVGLANLTRANLCRAAGIPNGSFNHIMGCGFVEFVEELRLEGITGADAEVSRKRLHPAIRRGQVLESAVKVAKRDGAYNMTREAIAEHAGVSPAMVTRSLGVMRQIRRDVMREAVRSEIVSIVAQGLAAGDSTALKAPQRLKERAARSLC